MRMYVKSGRPQTSPLYINYYFDFKGLYLIRSKIIPTEMSS